MRPKSSPWLNIGWGNISRSRQNIVRQHSRWMMSSVKRWNIFCPHLFATRCIESGVDIPTVSRWLGHKDGGGLAMKVYGHLRNQHSASMAKLVNFQPTNVVPLRQAGAA